MNNVIDFNKMFKKAKLDEVTAHTGAKWERLDDDDIESTAINIVYDVVDILGEIGLDVRDEPESIFELVLLTEVLKSIMYRLQGEDYSMQSVAEDLVEIEDPETALYDFLG